MASQRDVRVLVPILLLLGVAMAGCLAGDPAGPATGQVPVEGFLTTFQVLNASSQEPVFLAQITLLSGERPLLVASTSVNGTATLEVPGAATGYRVEAPGLAPHRSDSIHVVDVIVVKLQPLDSLVDELTSGAGGLTFRQPVDLGSFQYLVAVGTSCQDLLEDRDGDCGLGEPSVEVDALGQIYVSGVCCIGGAPPVYVSRDDGHTFELLRTPTGVREAFGIEGDFAIDESGILYFADIELAATFQVTAWDKDGNYLHHAKWPAPPLVDRDWIRAEGDGHLYYVYNTGRSTLVYTSQDRGVTWSPTAVHETSYGLGTAAKGPKMGELWLIGGSQGGHRLADYTLDGGATWSQEVTTLPTGSISPGYFDEAGNLYATSASGDTIRVAKRSADGLWHEAWVVSPEQGHHRMPWIAAGGEGKVAVAWYGTLDDTITAQSQWFLFVAVSLDAHTDHPNWLTAIADPEPVLYGNLGRQLLDFFQVVIGPQGAVHIAYSKLRPGDGTEEQMHYVQSERTLPLAPEVYFWGPK